MFVLLLLQSPMVTPEMFRGAALACSVDLRTFSQGGPSSGPAADLSADGTTILIEINQRPASRDCLKRWSERHKLRIILRQE